VLKFESLKSGRCFLRVLNTFLSMILIRAYAVCLYTYKWKFSSTPVRTVFSINTTVFYHPHRTVWSDMVKNRVYLNKD